MLLINVSHEGDAADHLSDIEEVGAAAQALANHAGLHH